MLFSWLRNRRRRRLLAEPFPIRWEPILRNEVGHFALLSPAEQARLRDIIRVFIAEKNWMGCAGLYVSEEMKVVIAAQAALLLLGIEHDYFRSVVSVVVHPTKFRTPIAEEGWEDDELSERELDGMAEYRGAVILSWEDVKAEAPDPTCGYNVVVHEFAHQLDFLDDLVYGTPRFGDPELESRWRYAMTVAYEDHRRLVAKGRETFFTEHAAESPTEFFADATEAFYCLPGELKEETPEVYKLLAAYYRVDPLKWFAGM